MRSPATGIYLEIARKRLPAYDPECAIDDLSYITLAYKGLDPEPDQELLDNWKSWTGGCAEGSPPPNFYQTTVDGKAVHGNDLKHIFSTALARGMSIRIHFESLWKSPEHFHNENRHQILW